MVALLDEVDDPRVEAAHDGSIIKVVLFEQVSNDFYELNEEHCRSSIQ